MSLLPPTTTTTTTVTKKNLHFSHYKYKYLQCELDNNICFLVNISSGDA